MVKTRFDSLSDPALVEVCNSGGRADATAAFGLLYRRHRDYVMRVALRFSSDREIAADTLQETFIYLLRKFPPSGEGLVLTARLLRRLADCGMPFIASGRWRRNAL